MFYSYLALGDSYTIGEGVPLYDSFPYQTVQFLRGAGRPFAAPEILARTGWTTDELALTLSRIRLLPRYDFVSLLIGVNNQYRGRGPGEYGPQFEALLEEAIRLAGSPSAEGPGGLAMPANLPCHRVFVLSIPDWSISPFAHASLPDAKGRQIADVAGEIDAFNAKAAQICRGHDVPFIDITTQGRSAGSDPSLFTADGLHPAAGQYRFWSEQLAAAIGQSIDAGGDGH
jgi:GDSL-like Lipase/Acylhydrolase family